MSIKNDIKIMPKAVVVDECTLRGDITIGTGSVVHPSACIIAEGGPIVIGENCIFEEYSTIINKSLPTDTEPFTMTIGPNNIFEVGCRVESRNIGEKNIFECKSYVSPQVTVTNGCVIGAGCQLLGEQELKENSVVFGKDCQQREAIEKQGSHILQVDFLRKVLPNYHHLKNKKKPGT
uniref:Dynactin subunit 6 n=1 Tax=Culicoides sonorensis TaxID=179676 RepID=A0A336MWP2_CULSO